MTSKEKFLIIKGHVIYASRHYRLGTTFVQLKEPYEKFELNAALDEIENDLDKLEHIKTLTQLSYAQRKLLKIEFDMWCKKNNADKNDKVNLITWLLYFKLKEELENVEKN